MKKSFFLSKGLEKFSKLDLKQMDNITGGDLYIPIEVYYPTGGGGRRCLQGQHWSNTLDKCVNDIEIAVEVAATPVGL